ncbi:MAG: hypothetical protein IGQ45_15470 [Cyanobacterium sp. T60_A2020_053]|nr:hypothetical protein [Cyanobacterium sp. T60_A2020_053]
MVLKKLLPKKNQSPKYFFEADIKEEDISQVTSEGETEMVEGAPQTITTSPTTNNNVSYDQPEWVKAIKNYSTPEPSENKTEVSTFAGQYVTNNVPSSRRRPGASLAMFKDMAKKINK